MEKANEKKKAVIQFYGAGNRFSNFHANPIVIDGSTWPTTEHYFQAQKFNNNAIHFEKIRKATTPALAKTLGSTRSVKLRPDWEAVKEQVMAKALRAKFTQHESLKQYLLQTGDADLVEHTDRDKYWGDGGNGTGQNRLGHLLMQLRTELVNI